jgi:hypothetical protein
MKKTWIAVPTAILGCLALGFLTGFLVLQARGEQRVEGAHVQWSSTADTVAEQVREANAIVRVRVEALSEPRVIENDLGVGPDGEARIERTPFTDVELSVIEVYKGEVGNRITVMQTGGILPETAQHESYRTEISSDRLYEVGTEHVLFLKDISGDRIHAPDRTLYRTVNPAGRYRIDGPRVSSTLEFGRVEQRPTQLGTLVSEIRWYRQQERIRQQ